MDCNTILRLKGHITAKQIVDYIDEHYKFIDSNVKEYNYGTLNKYNFKEKYDDSNEWKIESGFITFNDGDENITIFYFYQNINAYENLEYYSKYNLENMVKSETTFLSSVFCDNSVEIMKGIAREFGGWLDKNDCDNECPYWIDKVDKTRYCWSYDGDYYTGSFDTEQEAIEQVRENLGEQDEEIYVGTCEKATLSWDSNEEEIIESIYDSLYEECGEASESFVVTEEQMEELANRIDRCVERWISDMNIKPNCWSVRNVHLVKLR